MRSCQKIILTILLLPFSLIAVSQNNRNILKYVSLDMPANDSMYVVAKKLGKNKKQFITYYGKTWNSTMKSISCDTFITHKNYWYKIFNNELMPFLSRKDFLDTSRYVIEYSNRQYPRQEYVIYKPIQIMKLSEAEIWIYKTYLFTGNIEIEPIDTIYFSSQLGIVKKVNPHASFILENFLIQNDALSYIIH